MQQVDFKKTATFKQLRENSVAQTGKLAGKVLTKIQVGDKILTVAQNSKTLNHASGSVVPFKTSGSAVYSSESHKEPTLLDGRPIKISQSSDNKNFFEQVQTMLRKNKEHQQRPQGTPSIVLGSVNEQQQQFASEAQVSIDNDQDTTATAESSPCEVLVPSQKLKLPSLTKEGRNNIKTVSSTTRRTNNQVNFIISCKGQQQQQQQQQGDQQTVTQQKSSVNLTRSNSARIAATAQVQQKTEHSSQQFQQTPVENIAPSSNFPLNPFNLKKAVATPQNNLLSVNSMQRNKLTFLTPPHDLDAETLNTALVSVQAPRSPLSCPPHSRAITSLLQSEDNQQSHQQILLLRKRNVGGGTGSSTASINSSAVPAKELILDISFSKDNNCQWSTQQKITATTTTNQTRLQEGQGNAASQFQQSDQPPANFFQVRRNSIIAKRQEKIVRKLFSAETKVMKTQVA